MSKSSSTYHREQKHQERLRVGVLRGGPSAEYDVSLKTGAAILGALAHESLIEKYQPIDVFIDREGNWHVAGMELKPHDALTRVDVVVNGLHGAFGEDGKVQAILDRHGVPYTGSSSLASAVAMNKALTKTQLANNPGDNLAAEIIRTPRHVLVARDVSEARLHEIFKTFGVPLIVKPVSSGSSVGVKIAKGFHELADAIKHAFTHTAAHEDHVIIEEFITGVEATCGVIDNFRGEELYALPPVEIRPMGWKSGNFFDYEAKYGGKSQEIVPGNFTHSVKEEIMKLARAAHRGLGLRHYSRSDFIVSPRRGVFFLETNTQPGLTSESLLPKSLTAVGVTLPDFLDHLIGLAIARKNR